MAFRKVNLMSEKSILSKMNKKKERKNRVKSMPCISASRTSLGINTFVIMFESSLKKLPINLQFCHQQTEAAASSF